MQTRLVLRVLSWRSKVPHAVVVNSHAGMLWHQKLGYRPRRWEVIPNGFDLATFKPDPEGGKRLRKEFDLASDAVLVGLIARFDPMKDHATFLSAAAAIVRSRPAVHFFLVGKGVRSLANLIQFHDLTGRVELLDEQQHIHNLLQGFDLVCLSSASEGFPNVLGEAMACGVPCVTTDVGDARYLVDDTGLVVPPRDPDALAKALLDMIDRGQAARQQLGRLARDRIASKFSLTHTIKRYETLYEEFGKLPG